MVFFLKNRGPKVCGYKLFQACFGFQPSWISRPEGQSWVKAINEHNTRFFISQFVGFREFIAVKLHWIFTKLADQLQYEWDTNMFNLLPLPLAKLIAVFQMYSIFRWICSFFCRWWSSLIPHIFGQKKLGMGWFHHQLKITVLHYILTTTVVCQ